MSGLSWMATDELSSNQTTDGCGWGVAASVGDCTDYRDRCRGGTASPRATTVVPAAQNWPAWAGLRIDQVSYDDRTCRWSAVRRRGSPYSGRFLAAGAKS